MRYLIEIKMLATISESEMVTDRLHIDGFGTECCPLNILPSLVERAVEWGDENDACPFCGGRADVRVIREATAEDEKNYSPREPTAGEGKP